MLSNTFALLQGPPQPDSPRTLTPQAEKELEGVEQKIQEAPIQRMDTSQPSQILIFPLHIRLRRSFNKMTL